MDPVPDPNGYVIVVRESDEESESSRGLKRPWVIGPFESESDAKSMADDLERHSGARVDCAPLVSLEEADQVFEWLDPDLLGS